MQLLQPQSPCQPLQGELWNADSALERAAAAVVHSSLLSPHCTELKLTSCAVNPPCACAAFRPLTCELSFQTQFPRSLSMQRLPDLLPSLPFLGEAPKLTI